jgi:hypothetical protein
MHTHTHTHTYIYIYTRRWSLWIKFIIKWFHCTRTAVLCPRMWMRKRVLQHSSAQESSYWLRHSTYRRQNEKLHDSYTAIIIISRQQELSLEPTQSQLHAITTLVTRDFNVNLISSSRLFVSFKRCLSVCLFDYNSIKKYTSPPNSVPVLDKFWFWIWY